MNAASIDIGSNTVLLLIAAPVPGEKIAPLIQKAEVTRLGEGLGTRPFLKTSAIERTLKVLREYTDLCHRNQVQRVVCVGTEALRRAQNADEFIEEVEKTCGFRIEIISGKKEAQLAYFSAMIDFKKSYPNLVVVDVGGGSTEIVWKKEQTGHLQRLSLKMGSVRLHENHIESDPPTSQEVKQLRNIIESIYDENLLTVPPPKAPFTLIGLAGTVTTLCALDQQLAVYTSEKVHGATLSRKNLERVLNQLKKKNIQERLEMPGMEPKRADVILAGGMILLVLMEKMKVDSLIVSDHGIRYGAFYDRFLANT